MTPKPQTVDPLDQLAAQAQQQESEATAQLGQAPGDGAQQPEAQPEITNAQALGGAIAAAREVFCAFTKLESPKRVLTDEKVQQVAAVVGPVFDKYGINVGEYLGDFAIELTAAVVVFQVAMELRTAVRAEVATLEKNKPAAAPEAVASSADSTAVNHGQLTD